MESQSNQTTAKQLSKNSSQSDLKFQNNKNLKKTAQPLESGKKSSNLSQTTNLQSLKKDQASSHLTQNSSNSALKTQQIGTNQKPKIDLNRSLGGRVSQQIAPQPKLIGSSFKIEDSEHLLQKSKTQISKIEINDQNACTPTDNKQIILENDSSASQKSSSKFKEDALIQVEDITNNIFLKSSVQEYVQSVSFIKQPTYIQESGTNVKVFCRFRPLNQRELETTGNEMCVTFNNEFTCSINGINKDTGKQEPINYTFDATFDNFSTQMQVYKTAVEPIVESVLDGYNGTIFAYGQTSSGKTHTMLGEDIENEEERGIIPRLVTGIFNKIKQQPEDIEFSVRVSFVEIYNEKIQDLLDPKKNNLKIHENKQQGVYVKDMTENYVGSEDDVYTILKAGNENRAIGVTNMNKQSSRSHSVFIMQLEQKNLSDFSSKTGKIYLVDLAGSERIDKTGVVGQGLTEAQNINKSLTALGQVINALTDPKATHIPYRDSKLTRMLQESLGGNSKTSLIITCSPSIFNEKETISTLRFGQRAKQIKNKAKINKEFSIKELKQMLKDAEKAIKLKDQRINILEEYIEKLEQTCAANNVQSQELQKEKEKINQDKIFLNIQYKMQLEEETISKIDDQESRAFEESEESEDLELNEQSQQIDQVLNIGTGEFIPLDLDIKAITPEILKISRQDDLLHHQLDLQIRQNQQLQQQAEKKQNTSDQIQQNQDQNIFPSLNQRDQLKFLQLNQYEIIPESAAKSEESNQSFSDNQFDEKNDAFNILNSQKDQILQEIDENTIQKMQQFIQDDNSKKQKILQLGQQKLNLINQINILVKALMIERSKNRENEIKITIYKREYIQKVKYIYNVQHDQEQLIENVVQQEILNDKKQEQIDYLTQKCMSDKNKIDQLNEKIFNFESFVSNSQEINQNEAKEMEDKIDKRVKKIIDQERDLMKQQKRIILEKQKLQEQKIISLKQQLKEAKQIILKQKQIGQDEKEDSYKTTIDKLINSEKNLEQLKQMYHHLASSKEVLKKDYAVLEQKYKRQKQKIKSYDQELKFTREQTSEFKQKFKILAFTIQQKGGIELLNKLPNKKNSEILSFQDSQKTDDKISVISYEQDNSFFNKNDVSISNNRISIRGGQVQQQLNNSSNKTVIRGGARKNIGSNAGL